MRTKAEVEQELAKVRRLLSRLRRTGSEDDTDMLYGAQQALGWALGELNSPSKLQRTIERVAEKLFSGANNGR